MLFYQTQLLKLGTTCTQDTFEGDREDIGSSQLYHILELQEQLCSSNKYLLINKYLLNRGRHASCSQGAYKQVKLFQIVVAALKTKKTRSDRNWWGKGGDWGGDIDTETWITRRRCLQIRRGRSVEGQVPGRGHRRALRRNSLPVFQEYKGAVWLEGYKQGGETQDKSREAGRGLQQLPRKACGIYLGAVEALEAVEGF